MAPPYKIRITVVDKEFRKEWVEAYGDPVDGWKPCDVHEVGQEFLTMGGDMPEGFCPWAWCDIHKYVLVLARGGNMLGLIPGVFHSCCTDAQRPVFFRLERVDDIPK